MKKALALLAVASLLFFGCAENSSVVGPEQSSSSEVVKLSSQSTGKYQNNIQSDYSVSELIDGAEGGKIKFSFDDDDIKGDLKIPGGAFDSEQEITITISSSEAVIDFGPSPFSFNKNLEFSITYKGVELNPSDEKNLKFVYFDGNGQQTDVDYEKIKVDVRKGELGIKGAKLEHFSRYGFVR
ncbi:MAG: hypothetical protein KKD86_14495 [Bacteroidetes bacterium]|nr:hypothetical protein [Bacteroidota bacterium]